MATCLACSGTGWVDTRPYLMDVRSVTDKRVARQARAIPREVRTMGASDGWAPCRACRTGRTVRQDLAESRRVNAPRAIAADRAAGAREQRRADTVSHVARRHGMGMGIWNLWADGSPIAPLAIDADCLAGLDRCKECLAAAKARQLGRMMARDRRAADARNAAVMAHKPVPKDGGGPVTVANAVAKLSDFGEGPVPLRPDRAQDRAWTDPAYRLRSSNAVKAWDSDGHADRMIGMAMMRLAGGFSRLARSE